MWLWYVRVSASASIARADASPSTEVTGAMDPLKEPSVHLLTEPSLQPKGNVLYISLQWLEIFFCVGNVGPPALFFK